MTRSHCSSRNLSVGHRAVHDISRVDRTVRHLVTGNGPIPDFLCGDGIVLDIVRSHGIGRDVV